METYTKEFILSEVKKLQYLYGLKREIRYAQTRLVEDSTESVAEHIYGMHICALYFIPLENPRGDWDQSRIFKMITLHDIDEIDTGDVIGYTKTDAMRKVEAEAMRVVMGKSPKHIQELMAEVIDEYEAQETKEAKFVKAIDKFEPTVHLYNDKGRAIMAINKTTSEQHMSIKLPYMNDTPIIKLYTNTMHEIMLSEGFYHIK